MFFEQLVHFGHCHAIREKENAECVVADNLCHVVLVLQLVLFYVLPQLFKDSRPQESVRGTKVKADQQQEAR